MARKKKSSQADDVVANGGANGNSPSSTPNAPLSNGNGPAPSKKSTTEPSTSALIICRNKHWRYISSFHGPWLQLPPEVLESLALTNYLSPRPHPIDPSVFYDLVKIRKAVDEATNLAVRATSGLTSAALSSSLNAGNGMLGSAAALGIGYGGGGGNAKLSRERKHRMRELATAKLSQAYHLDEIAASVATMQSASTLEDVAHLVLQRNPGDIDAKYVHFFHEKIPSRMMAQCTPLDTLNDIITERPHDGSAWRTRALTRIFKDDYVNSAKDLSEGLALARYLAAQHRAGKDQLVLAKTMQEQYGRDWREQVKIPEEDQPNSLETQLLFHRAGVYFTIACQHVHDALDGLRESVEAQARREERTAGGEKPIPLTAQEQEADRRRSEARKQVRANAKRAIRDYIAFLSHFEYTPGISSKIAEEFLRRLGNSTNGYGNPKEGSNKPLNRPLDSSSNPSSPVSEALVPHRRPQNYHSDRPSWPKLPPPEIFKASQLFDAAPPASLPPYPLPTPTSPAASAASAAATAFADSHESITYHPLLTDALHSLLLCHALIQTPPKELLRHAHNAARLARVCDGYPIFLAARSPARADWIEVIRRAGNWINLTTTWENLCRPAPLPGHSKNTGSPSDSLTTKHPSPSSPTIRQETETQKRERQKHEAILEALADERVVDEDSFQRAVRARERRFREDEEAEEAEVAVQNSKPASNSDTTDSPTTPTANGTSASSNGTTTSSEKSPTTSASAPRRWAQDDSREYPITTERAEAISRWVREAPLLLSVSTSLEGENGTKKKKKRTGKGKKGSAASGGAGSGLGLGQVSASTSTTGLEESVGTLSVRSVQEEDEEGEEVE